jgi:hypothetical protein
MTLMLAIQLVSLGIIASQSKVYFEEMFHLRMALKQLSRADEKERT